MSLYTDATDDDVNYDRNPAQESAQAHSDNREQKDPSNIVDQTGTSLPEGPADVQSNSTGNVPEDLILESGSTEDAGSLPPSPPVQRSIA